MPLDLVLVSAGIVVRQIDRWWFSDWRPDGGWRISQRAGSSSIRQLVARQRARRNDVTPILLLVGHWSEIVGYLLACTRPGPLIVPVVVLALAVKARHLQEVSHFGVHGSLCRRRRLGDLLAEVGAQGPLVLATVDNRRESHVRQHHPNAAVPGLDPNLAELSRAGFRPGCTGSEFRRGLFFPITPAGVQATVQSMWSNGFSAQAPRRRLVIVAAVCGVALLIGGVPALAALALARLVIYPQMAWFSLLVEHQWFAFAGQRGRPRDVESRRCVRIYPGRIILSTMVRLTVLPFGDLFHFAHSVHPAMRWNYLPAAERLIGLPTAAPARVFFGESSLVATLRRSLAGEPPPEQSATTGVTLNPIIVR